MNVKWILAGALTLFIGINAYRFQRRGLRITDLETALSDTTRLYRFERGRADRGEEYMVRLRTDSAALSGQVKDYQTAAATARAESAETVNALEQRTATAIASLSARLKKQEADRPAGGVGVIRTSVGDTSLNGDVATLKHQVRAYRDTIVPGLVRENTVLRIDKSRAEEQVSELEKTLNGVRQSDARRVETMKRTFLGIGARKEKIRAANDIRAGRTN